MSNIIDFKAHAQKYINGLKKTWTIDRSKTIGASEAFQCIRRTWYAKHTPDIAVTGDMGMAERGNVIENGFAVPFLRSLFEDKILYIGADQKSLVDGQNSSTPDGLAIDQPLDALSGYDIVLTTPEFGIEIKSFDPRAHLEEEKAQHRGQAQIQMGTFHAVTKYRPMVTVILYINASNLSDIRPFFVHYDPEVYKAAKERARQVFAAKRAEDMMAEGPITDECRYCPFKTTCRSAEVSSVERGKDTAPPEVLDNIYTLAVKRDELSKIAKKSKKQLETANAELKLVLHSFNLKKAKDSRFSVTHAIRPGKKSLDDEALSEYLARDGKSLEDFQTAGNAYTALTVTVKGNKEDYDDGE